MRIGIDLGGTKIEGILMDAGGAIAARHRLPTPQGDYDGTIRTIGNVIAHLTSSLDGATASPVGVGMPGSISRRTGLIKNANSTCLNGRPFTDDLAAHLKRDVRVANDANCFALSEASDGAAAGKRVVFGVILGTGVGGGVVVDGRILDGINGIGGEWGHNPLPWPTPAERDGPACYCGKTGCIETWVSGPGFAADFERTNGERLTAEEIITAAANSSACAQAELETLGQRIGKSLATIVNVIDPDVIVLGGGLSNIAALYTLIPAALSRYAFSDGVSTPVVKARHGDSSGVRGAAWLWPA
ncbi:Fructokinase [Alphaproteobacteria bacterium SO-S41]|nr:Fructokinase [Alphaproteobacteria bacterium SO-S41]